MECARTEFRSEWASGDKLTLTDNPITVVWKLQQAVPDRLRAELKVPGQ